MRRVTFIYEDQQRQRQRDGAAWDGTYGGCLTYNARSERSKASSVAVFFNVVVVLLLFVMYQTRVRPICILGRHASRPT